MRGDILESDDSFDAALGKMLVAEVDDKTERLVHQLHVGEKLHAPDVHVLILTGLRLYEIPKCFWTFVAAAITSSVKAAACV